MTDAGFASVFPPRRARADRPGAAAIVAKGGKALFRAAYGAANIASGAALDPAALFRIGSLTKQFTAAAILLLIEEKALSFADPLNRFLPDFPAPGARATIEQLLTHTSGLRNYTDMPRFAGIMNSETPLSGMIDFFKDAAPAFPAGEGFAYSNTGYFLLGAIIERVSGDSYADFLARRIFVPLGMADTAVEGQERGLARRVTGYNRDREAPPIAMCWPYAAGAIVSSVNDLARWNAAMSAGQLLSPGTWTRATTPHKLPNGRSTGYGFGFLCGQLQKSATLEHGGGIPGFSGYALRLPQEDIFVAVLGNDDGMNILSLLGALWRRDDPRGLTRKLAAIALTI